MKHTVAEIDLSVSSAVVIKGTCPVCKTPIVIKGEHPPAKVEVFFEKPDEEKDRNR